jgi:hypothetical protein
MKGLFIIFEALSDHSGISKKIKAQVKGFINNGIEMELSSFSLDDTKNYNYATRTVNGKVIENFKTNSLLNKIQRISCFNKLYEYIQKNKIDFVYIRYVHTASPFFIKFLKKLKENSVKILLEIPTYPYDDEYKYASLKQKTFLIVEKFYRKKLRYYVDNIITVQNYNSIFGINTIKIGNGFDLTDIPIVKKDNSIDSINLIGVASLNIAHGFDRVIKGLCTYYSKPQLKQVYFHIVGDSNTKEANKYKRLVSSCNLTNYVIFHGKRFGKELDLLFNSSDIGIGCLGNHRKKIVEAKSLKNREYCARGIPFIYSEIDEDFDDKSFVIKAPADESPINIMQIIEFLEINKNDKNKIREYAEKYLTWEIQVKKIFENIPYTNTPIN